MLEPVGKAVVLRALMASLGYAPVLLSMEECRKLTGGECSDMGFDLQCKFASAVRLYDELTEGEG